MVPTTLLTLYGAAASGAVAVAVEAALTLLAIPFTLVEGATWAQPAAPAGRRATGYAFGPPRGSTSAMMAIDFHPAAGGSWPGRGASSDSAAPALLWM